jgi:hypothetical protein
MFSVYNWILPLATTAGYPCSRINFSQLLGGADILSYLLALSVAAIAGCPHSKINTPLSLGGAREGRRGRLCVWLDKERQSAPVNAWMQHCMPHICIYFLFCICRIITQGRIWGTKRGIACRVGDRWRDIQATKQVLADWESKTTCLFISYVWCNNTD